jgi:activator of HSP90 ATPase
MAKVVQQKVKLKGISPESLYDTYLDPKKHAAVIGFRVSVSKQVGATFTAFDGDIRGKNLLIVPKRLIVQSWRSNSWKPDDLDSILILRFSKIAGVTQIHLVHANIPDHDYTGVNQGWAKYYWKPWKSYLKQKRAKG